MDKKTKFIEARFREILIELGLDLNSDGLKGTPLRYAKFIREFTTRPKFTFTLFSEKVDEMLIQNGIPVASLCEHHTLPFFGTAAIAYLPNGHTIGGLSKLARLVRHYARGLQNQERLTKQVGEYLTNSDLAPKAVGVSIRCYHTCMSIRGIEAQNAVTTTQYLSGLFKTDASARAEFLQAVRHPQVYQ
jgi:GTP cyclohydrolase I